MYFVRIITSFIFSAYLSLVSNVNESSHYLRRSLLAYQESGTTYKAVANDWAVMTSNNMLRLSKEFRYRVEQDAIKFFESQRLRSDSAVNHNSQVPGLSNIQPVPSLKEDPVIPVATAYLPKVTRSATCIEGNNGYTCVPNKESWTSNPGNFAFLYYNTMEECLAKDGQPFYFYSEFQTSCTSGIRVSANKYTKTVTVKSYANLDCTGSVKTKYSYQLSATSFPTLADYNVCHDSKYSAGIVKIVII